MGRPRTTGDWLANGDIKFNSLSRPSLSLSFSHSHNLPDGFIITRRPAGQSSSRLDPTANALHLLSVQKILVRDTISPNRKRNKIKTWNSPSTSQDAASLNQIKSIFGCCFLSCFLHFSFPSGWIPRESACRRAHRGLRVWSRRDWPPLERQHRNITSHSRPFDYHQPHLCMWWRWYPLVNGTRTDISPTPHTHKRITWRSFLTWNVPYVVQIKKKERTTTTTITEKEREKEKRANRDNSHRDTRDSRYTSHPAPRVNEAWPGPSCSTWIFRHLFFFPFSFSRLSRTPFFDVLVWVVARREFQTTSSKTTKTRRERKGREEEKEKHFFLRMLNPFGRSKVKNK